MSKPSAGRKRGGTLRKLRWLGIVLMGAILLAVIIGHMAGLGDKKEPRQQQDQQPRKPAPNADGNAEKRPDVEPDPKEPGRKNVPEAIAEKKESKPAPSILELHAQVLKAETHLKATHERIMAALSASEEYVAAWKAHYEAKLKLEALKTSGSARDRYEAATARLEARKRVDALVSEAFEGNQDYLDAKRALQEAKERLANLIRKHQQQRGDPDQDGTIDKKAVNP